MCDRAMIIWSFLFLSAIKKKYVVKYKPGEAIVENMSTHQIVPKISPSVMSLILSPQCNNETEQKSFSAKSISVFLFSNHEVRRTTTQNRLDKHDFM